MDRSYVGRAVVRALVPSVAIVACASAVHHAIYRPDAATLRPAAEAQAVLDTATRVLIIAHGVIRDRLYIDTIPAGEIISLEILPNTHRGADRPETILQVLRCAQADTSFGGGRRMTITTHGPCPWTLPPKAER